MYTVKILNYLENSKPKSINEILKEIGIGVKNKQKLNINLENLIEDEKIIKIPGERYTIPGKTGYYVGKYEMVRGNFGFVDTKTTNIFIAREDNLNAVTGDDVLVKITKESIDGKKSEGKIIEIINRNKRKITGRYQSSKDFGFVVPREPIGKDIYIYKRNTKNAKTGDMVVVNITNWGDEKRKPEGEIVRILGDGYSSDTMIEALLIDKNYSLNFSKEVINEVDLIDEPTKEEYINRRNLTKYNFITIDGADAKDLDDAVYLEELKNGNYLINVSIADVSHYVKKDSFLDKEAFARGNSVYLVDRVIPMLPQRLSNNICSLNEGVDRLTFSVEFEIDKDGKIINSDIYKSVINVKRRTTYKMVNELFKEKENSIDSCDEIEKMLFNMKKIAEKIEEIRFSHGSINFDLPEIKVVLDENKKVDYIKKIERGISEKIIESFMIIANEIVAEKVFWLDMPYVYRIHEQPDIIKMKELNNFLTPFGYRIYNIDEIYPGKIQKIIEDIKDKECKMVLNKMILMSLKQARYSPKNEGHFGLASNYYSHFTAPIRRYSDLIAHRILGEITTKYPDQKWIKKTAKKLENITDHISSTERKAMKVEDDSIKIKLTEYMMDKIGVEYNATIVGISNNNIFLELDNYVEVLIDNYEEKNYFFDKKNYKILEKKTNTEYNIGNKIRVIVVRVCLENLIIEVKPVKEMRDDTCF
ncbi:MAG: ribonuclease R [Fusobacteria bacterium]|nr:ribonuclease R [Fusobacteriota bacterium]